MTRLTMLMFALLLSMQAGAHSSNDEPKDHDQDRRDKIIRPLIPGTSAPDYGAPAVIIKVATGRLELIDLGNALPQRQRQILQRGRLLYARECALVGPFELGLLRACLEQAAVREALEETALRVTLRALLGLYSDPQRDPRGQTVTAVSVAEAEATGEPRAQDDARNLAVFPVDALPEILAFDHALVLRDYRSFRDTGEVAPLRGGSGNR